MIPLIIGMPVTNFFDGSKLLLENGRHCAQIHSARFKLSKFQQKTPKANDQPPCDIVAGIRPCRILLDEGELTAKVEASAKANAPVCKAYDF